MTPSDKLTLLVGSRQSESDPTRVTYSNLYYNSESGQPQDMYLIQEGVKLPNRNIPVQAEEIIRRALKASIEAHNDATIYIGDFMYSDQMKISTQSPYLIRKISDLTPISTEGSGKRRKLFEVLGLEFDVETIYTLENERTLMFGVRDIIVIKFKKEYVTRLNLDEFMPIKTTLLDRIYKLFDYINNTYFI